VRAVIVRAPHDAATGRGLRILERQSRVMDVYPEVPSEDSGREVRGVKNEKQQIEVRRYDALGLGFEMHKRKVTAITLYPAVAAP
jgi:hypothetical protein